MWGDKGSNCGTCGLIQSVSAANRLQNLFFINLVALVVHSVSNFTSRCNAALISQHAVCAHLLTRSRPATVCSPLSSSTFALIPLYSSNPPHPPPFGVWLRFCKWVRKAVSRGNPAGITSYFCLCFCRGLSIRGLSLG